VVASGAAVATAVAAAAVTGEDGRGMLLPLQ